MNRDKLARMCKRYLAKCRLPIFSREYLTEGLQMLFVLCKGEEAKNTILAAANDDVEIVLIYPFDETRHFIVPPYFETENCFMDYLENGYEICDISLEGHYSIWICQDEYGDDSVLSSLSFQKYLHYCVKNGVTFEKLNQEFGYEKKDFISLYYIHEKVNRKGESYLKKHNGISREDPQAVEKLRAKIDACRASQEKMKAVNAYYRKHETLKDCPYLSKEEIEEVTENFRRYYPIHDKPYPSFLLTNNNAEIRRLEKRLEELTRDKETGFVGWKFEGGEAIANEDECRLQLVFDEKPSEEQRRTLKRNGFVWSPTNEAWQRQLNGNAIRVANYIDFIKPLDGKRPTELQPKREPKDKEREER